MGHVGEGERTGPQPSESLLPLTIGGPWVHSANVLSLNPPQAAQWKGRLFPGHGGRGTRGGTVDTWGCRAEGNRASPHCPTVSFLHLDSQPLWMAVPLPSCTPAPVPTGLVAHTQTMATVCCVCRGQRRDRLRRGLKLPPQRQEPGRRFARLDGDPRPHTGQDPCRRRDGAPRPLSAQIQQMHTCHRHGRMCSLVSGEG